MQEVEKPQMKKNFLFSMAVSSRGGGVKPLPLRKKNYLAWGLFFLFADKVPTAINLKGLYSLNGNGTTKINFFGATLKITYLLRKF